MTSPSMAVVRNSRDPQTMGEECERPGTATFQAIRRSGAQSAGSDDSTDTPWPDGPRHCAQFASARATPAPAAARISTTASRRARFDVGMVASVVNELTDVEPNGTNGG